MQRRLCRFYLNYEGYALLVNFNCRDLAYETIVTTKKFIRDVKNVQRLQHVNHSRAINTIVFFFYLINIMDSTDVNYELN